MIAVPVIPPKYISRIDLYNHLAHWGVVRQMAELQQLLDEEKIKTELDHSFTGIHRRILFKSAEQYLEAWLEQKRKDRDDLMLTIGAFPSILGHRHADVLADIRADAQSIAAFLRKQKSD